MGNDLQTQFFLMKIGKYFFEITLDFLLFLYINSYVCIKCVNIIIGLYLSPSLVHGVLMVSDLSVPESLEGKSIMSSSETSGLYAVNQHVASVNLTEHSNEQIGLPLADVEYVQSQDVTDAAVTKGISWDVSSLVNFDFVTVPETSAAFLLMGAGIGMCAIRRKI